MADNTTLPGTGEVIAADDIGGIKHQRVKIVWGTDGTANDADTASGKPMPAQLRDSDGTDVALTAKLGALTESAPGTDTASSGLNGRLQRIAQRITSLIALIPAALTGSGNFKVALVESTASQAVTGTFFQGTQPVSGTFWQGTQPVSGTFWQATQPISGTLAATQSGTWTVQPGNTPNSTPWLVSEVASISGGLSLPYSFISTAAVQAAAIKASPGQVYALHFFNISATPVYVRLYNMTTTPGTGDTVVYRAIIPGNTSGAGFVVPIPPGVTFTTGIGIRVTAAIADADNTALTANVVLGNVFFE